MAAPAPTATLVDATSVNKAKDLIQTTATNALTSFQNTNSFVNNLTDGIKSLENNQQFVGKSINVIKKFRWTLSETSSFEEEIPTITLTEYKCTESVIKRQLNLYERIVPDTVSNIRGLFSNNNNKKLSTAKQVYENIWPTDKPTGFVYTLPYFNPTAFSVQTQEWTALGAIGDSLKNFVSNIPVVGGDASKLMSIADKASDLGMMLKYPHVGVVDRPRLFGSHSHRNIVISFPLYNTVNLYDWVAHREFVQTLITQNLFYKRDYVTGIPPVFYQVSVPNQYFCYASCITDITVKNLGNIRKIENEIVPDAYQVEITLTELVMPSQNQFVEAMKDAKTSSVNPLGSFTPGSPFKIL